MTDAIIIIFFFINFRRPPYNFTAAERAKYIHGLITRSQFLKGGGEVRLVIWWSDGGPLSSYPVRLFTIRFPSIRQISHACANRRRTCPSEKHDDDFVVYIIQSYFSLSCHVFFFLKRENIYF